jgi:hypothetical protein
LNRRARFLVFLQIARRLSMGLFGKDEPEEVTVVGKPLHCEICKHNRFWHRRAQLHTAVASFFNFEWIAPSADCMVCAQCGYIHWFLQS